MSSSIGTSQSEMSPRGPAFGIGAGFRESTKRISENSRQRRNSLRRGQMSVCGGGRLDQRQCRQLEHSESTLRMAENDDMIPPDTSPAEAGEVSTARLPPDSGRNGSAVDGRVLPADAFSLTASLLTACLARAFVLPGGQARRRCDHQVLRYDLRRSARVD